MVSAVSWFTALGQVDHTEQEGQVRGEEAAKQADGVTSFPISQSYSVKWGFILIVLQIIVEDKPLYCKSFILFTSRWNEVFIEAWTRQWSLFLLDNTEKLAFLQFYLLAFKKKKKPRENNPFLQIFWQMSHLYPPQDTSPRPAPRGLSQNQNQVQPALQSPVQKPVSLVIPGTAGVIGTSSRENHQLIAARGLTVWLYFMRSKLSVGR